MKIVMFGLGGVGTVTAASHGHDIWGVDVGGAKVDEIRAGCGPVARSVLDVLTAQPVAGGTLHKATTSCFDAVDRADV